MAEPTRPSRADRRRRRRSGRPPRRWNDQIIAADVEIRPDMHPWVLGRASAIAMTFDSATYAWADCVADSATSRNLPRRRPSPQVCRTSRGCIPGRDPAPGGVAGVPAPGGVAGSCPQSEGPFGWPLRRRLAADPVLMQPLSSSASRSGHHFAVATRRSSHSSATRSWRPRCRLAAPSTASRHGSRSRRRRSSVSGPA